MTDECRWCGSTHAGSCPRVREIEFYQDGSVARVEFHEAAPMSPSVWWADRDGWMDAQKQLHQKPDVVTLTEDVGQIVSYVLTASPSQLPAWASNVGWRKKSFVPSTFVGRAGDTIKTATRMEQLLGVAHGTRVYLGPDYHQVAGYSVIMEHAAANRLMIVDA